MNAKGVKQADIASALSISKSIIKRVKARESKYRDIKGGKKKTDRKLLFSSCMRDINSTTIDSIANLLLRRYYL
jgi:hypothetical protein